VLNENAVRDPSSYTRRWADNLSLIKRPLSIGRGSSTTFPAAPTLKMPRPTIMLTFKYVNEYLLEDLSKEGHVAFIYMESIT